GPYAPNGDERQGGDVQLPREPAGLGRGGPGDPGARLHRLHAAYALRAHLPAPPALPDYGRVGRDPDAAHRPGDVRLRPAPRVASWPVYSPRRGDRRVASTPRASIGDAAGGTPMKNSALLRLQLNEAFDWLDDVVRDLNPEQYSWQPDGSANPISKLHAHTLSSADF